MLCWLCCGPHCYLFLCSVPQGNTLAITEDMQALRPTIFPSVPRLLNKIYDKIMGGVEAAGGAKAAMFKQAFEAKRYWLKRGHLKHKLWDGLVFNKVSVALREGIDCCGAMMLHVDVVCCV